MRSRAFFTTDSQYLGFDPNCTAAGDQIFLLIGSDVPFILRPAGNDFELVGAWYVHGIMYGEGLCRNFYISNPFYPGSEPIQENRNNTQIGGSVCQELARTTWDTTSKELKD